MLVEPGFFRTEPAHPASPQYAEASIEDYAERTTATVKAWKGMDGKQGGDPAKLADALVEPEPSRSLPCAPPPAPTPSPPSSRRPTSS